MNAPATEIGIKHTAAEGGHLSRLPSSEKTAFLTTPITLHKSRQSLDLLSEHVDASTRELLHYLAFSHQEERGHLVHLVLEGGLLVEHNSRTHMIDK